MKVKKINEYSNEELNELLRYWFNNFQKKVYTLEESDKFKSMVDKNPRSVLNTAVILYNNGDGATPVLDGIRGDTKKIEEAIAKWKKLKPTQMLKATNEFIGEIVESYNNPEENLMSGEDFISELVSILGKTEDVQVIDLTEFFKPQTDDSIDFMELERILEDSLFKDDEIVDGVPTSNFVKAKGLDSEIIFSAKKLNKHKDKIKEFIDKLPSLTKPRSFLELAVTKDGYRWAITQEQVELLVTLGIACGYLTQSEVKDNIPYYKASKKRVNKVVGEPKENFRCFKNILEKEKKRKLSRKEIVEAAIEHSTDETQRILELLGYKIEFDNDAVFFHKLDEDIILEANIKIKHNLVEILAEMGDFYVSYSIRLDGFIDDELLIYDRIRVNTINKEKTDGEYFSIAFGNSDTEPKKAYGMEIDYVNPKEKQKHCVFSASKNQVFVETEAEYDEDAKDNTIRRFSYTDPTKESGVPTILLVSEEYNGEGFEVNVSKVDDNYFHMYSSNSNRNKLGIVDNSFKVKDSESARDLALKYTNTSRVRNLYDHVISVIDSHLPGAKNFVNECIPFSSYVEEIMKCEPDKDYEEFINKCKIKEANLPSESERPKRRKKM